MTTREPDEPRPRDLDGSARDAAALLDERIAAARPIPDFAAMLARARELAPDVVSEAAVARAAALPPVIPLGPAGRDDAAALAPFTMALRAELDAKIAERRMASIPPPPMPRRERRLGLVLGLAVAVAAVLALVFVRPSALGRLGPQSAVEANAEGVVAPGGAARHVDPGPERQVVEARDEAAAAPVPQDSMIADEAPVPQDRDEAATGPVPQDSMIADEAPVPGAREDIGQSARDERGSARPRARSRAADPGAGPSLEDEAQALWERGELAAAERKLREVLAVAGRSGRAELAFGDLFALVRQLRGADGQVAVWREYLDRFPAGRFADDARAGLCLRAAGDARGRCWRDYLERHPRGIHQAQARAALASDDEASP